MSESLIGNLVIALLGRTVHFEESFKRAAGTMKRMELKFRSIAKRMTSVGKTLTTRLTAPLTLFAGTILKVAGDFQAAMKVVQAKTGETGARLGALAQKARDLGASTAYSATEAAQAMGILGQAGLKAAQIFRIVGSVLSLAAASGLDMSTAAAIVTKTMTQFQIPTKRAGHVADVLVKAANSANQTVLDLGESLKKAGGIAKDFNNPFEDIVATLTILARAGYAGEDGGTAVRNAIAALASPSAPMSKVLSDLKVKTRDSNGQLRKFLDIIDDLVAAGVSGTQVMEMFEKRTGAVLISLFSAIRKDGGVVRSLGDELRNSTGAAAKEAAIRLSGLNGEIQKLRSAFQEFQLTLADTGLLSFATGLIVKLTELINSLAQTNPELLQLAVLLAAAAAAIGPLMVLLGQLSLVLAVAVPAAVALATAAFALIVPALKIALIVGVAALFYKLGNIIYDGLVRLKAWTIEQARDLGAKIMEKIIEPLGDFASKVGGRLSAGFGRAKAWILEQYQSMGETASREILTPMEELPGKAVALFRRMGEESSEAMLQPLRELPEKLRIQSLDPVFDRFVELYDGLVGNSVVPDMVLAIKGWMDKLPKFMTSPVESASGMVESAYESMKDKVTASISSMVSTIRAKLASIRNAGKLPTGKNPFADDPDEAPSAGGETKEENRLRRANVALLELKAVGKEVGKSLNGSLGGALDNFIEKGKLSFDTFRSLAAEALGGLAKGLLRKGIGGLFGIDLGGAAGSLPGFAKGGDFTVSGAGGTDSQLVAFRATPKEEVSIRRPGQRMGSGGPQVIQNNSFPMGLDAAVQAAIVRQMPQLARVAEAAVADRAARSGRYRGPFRGR